MQNRSPNWRGIHSDSEDYNLHILINAHQSSEFLSANLEQIASFQHATITILEILTGYPNDYDPMRRLSGLSYDSRTPRLQLVSFGSWIMQAELRPGTLSGFLKHVATSILADTSFPRRFSIRNDSYRHSNRFESLLWCIRSFAREYTLYALHTMQPLSESDLRPSRWGKSCRNARS